MTSFTRYHYNDEEGRMERCPAQSEQNCKFRNSRRPHVSIMETGRKNYDAQYAWRVYQNTREALHERQQREAADEAAREFDFEKLPPPPATYEGERLEKLKEIRGDYNGPYGDKIVDPYLNDEIRDLETKIFMGCATRKDKANMFQRLRWKIKNSGRVYY